MIVRTLTRSLLLAGMAAGLLACGGSGSGSPATQTAQLQGVVAVGAPIVGASIQLSCSIPVTLTPVSSSGTGAWATAVPQVALPCALSASGGTVGGVPNTQTLHSLALTAGTVNITPLTDLLVAAAVDTAPATWFASLTPERLAAAAQAAADASAAIRQALQSAGYALPSGFSPLDMVFSALGGDPYDDLLEAFSAAINTAGTSYSAVLAQWSAPGTPPALPTAPATSGGAGTGDGAALNGGNGATATVAGTVFTRTANVGWLVVQGQSTGNFDASGGTDSAINALERWLIRNVPATVGTHACAGTTGLNIQLQDGGRTLSTAPSGGRCAVEVIAVTGNTITGRFAGTLIDGLSGESSTMADGYFRLAASTGGGQLPQGQTGVSFDVAGTTYGYSSALDASYADSFRNYTFIAVTGTPVGAEASSPGFPLGVQIHTLPQATGTYACDQEAVPTVSNPDYRKVNIWFWWNGEWYYAGNRAQPAPGPAGSSCSITLTDVTNSIEGNFSGTFVTADLQRSVTVTNGLFRAAR